MNRDGSPQNRGNGPNGIDGAEHFPSQQRLEQEPQLEDSQSGEEIPIAPAEVNAFGQKQMKNPGQWNREQFESASGGYGGLTLLIGSVVLLATGVVFAQKFCRQKAKVCLKNIDYDFCTNSVPLPQQKGSGY